MSAFSIKTADHYKDVKLSWVWSRIALSHPYSEEYNYSRFSNFDWKVIWIKAHSQFIVLDIRNVIIVNADEIEILSLSVNCSHYDSKAIITHCRCYTVLTCQQSKTV